MIVCNIEADEIIQQIVNSCTKRQWCVQYYFAGWGEYVKYRKKRDKKTLIKVLNRAGWQADDYDLVMEEQQPTLDECLVVLHSKLKWIRERIIEHYVSCGRVNLWLGPTDGSNFRYKSAVTLPYKGTRKEKPEVLKQLREYLISVKGANVIYGYEADDALGINQSPVFIHEALFDNTSGWFIGKPYRPLGIGNTIAVHCDKDIKQIPGEHFDTLKDEFYTVIDPGTLLLNNGKVTGTGLYFFYYQLLKGDMTDNIPALKKGWGDVRCYNALADCSCEEQMLQNVITNYRIELSETAADMKWKDRLLEQADLVWICRDKEEKGSHYIKRRYRELTGYEL